ncbi:hypothetical protein C8Q79DRAFT_421138 [Trametes meyenii]|nr:hypothetical protein C8Q79DRAFT_421138 [Trametes meyenii]
MRSRGTCIISIATLSELTSSSDLGSAAARIPESSLPARSHGALPVNNPHRRLPWSLTKYSVPVGPTRSCVVDANFSLLFTSSLSGAADLSVFSCEEVHFGGLGQDNVCMSGI